MTRTYRYRRRALLVEAMQGSFGFAVTAGLLRFAEPAHAVLWVLAAAAGLFLVYFARAVVRYLTHIELDERGIRIIGPLGAAISWDDVRALRLEHYSTRKDRTGGWMQLVVRGARVAIRIDSSLAEFTGLAAIAGGEALRRGCTVDDNTRANFSALGIALHE